MRNWFLQDIINKEAIRLYRLDDGLTVLNKVTSQNINKIRKKIIQLFDDNDFSIDIVTNLVEVNFLDFTFNHRNGSYRWYKKANDERQYQCLVKPPTPDFKTNNNYH